MPLWNVSNGMESESKRGEENVKIERAKQTETIYKCNSETKWKQFKMTPHLSYVCMYVCFAKEKQSLEIVSDKH